MTQIQEERFIYDFPDSWDTLKFDDATFYKRHFQSFAGGTRAVDLLAFDRNAKVLWLVECKDCRLYPRTKLIDLFEEIAHKVRGTLACLMAANANATDEPTLSFVRTALKLHKIRCVLHLEQPVKNSKLFPQVIDPKTARDAMRRALRPIDPHALVGGEELLNGQLAWQTMPIAQ